MAGEEHNTYILGTDAEELYRLGLQHQIWAEETQHGWKLAKFNAGQTILDLGCGPGFCSKELAFLTGPSGKVIGVDKSEYYIAHLKATARLHHLNIEAIAADFNDMNLQKEGLDGMYCRWAMAWLPNPKDILANVVQALKPGGKMVIHEYSHWATHQTEPQKSGLSKAIAAALKSFKDSEGVIDIGRELPRILQELGMKIVSTRPMAKLATPKDTAWQWPKSFYESYFPRLVQPGYLSEEEVAEALQDLHTLEHTTGSSIFCPMMVEIIAQKKG